jgi:hypothetical protein
MRMRAKSGIHAPESPGRNLFPAALLTAGLLLSPGCDDNRPARAGLGDNLKAIETKVKEVEMAAERRDSFNLSKFNMVVRSGESLHVRKGMQFVRERDILFILTSMSKPDYTPEFSITKIGAAGVEMGRFRFDFGSAVTLTDSDIKLPVDITIKALPGPMPKTAFVHITYPNEK